MVHWWARRATSMHGFVFGFDDGDLRWYKREALEPYVEAACLAAATAAEGGIIANETNNASERVAHSRGERSRIDTVAFVDVFQASFLLCTHVTCAHVLWTL